MAKTLVLIDGNSLVFRAFHALPPMNREDGTPVNAAYGFFTMLLRILQERTPDYLGVAFDVAQPTFRKKLYPDYKGTRAKTPEELLLQIPLIQQALSKLGVRVLTLPGYEADDILGTLSARAEAEGVFSYLYTGDRDALQLISPATQVMLTRKGVSEVEVYDAAHLQEVLGLEPWQIIDMKGLQGDASDNIPGIAGVGEKTALKLLHQFGSVENLYAHIDELPKNKMREKVENGRESAFFSKQLAAIERDAPLELPLSALAFAGLADEPLLEVLEDFGFQSIAKRMGLKRQPAAEAPAQRELGSLEDVRALCDRARAAGQLAMCEAEGKLCFYSGGGEEVFLSLQPDLFGERLSLAQAMPVLREVLADEAVEKTVYDAKALLHLCAAQQATLAGIAFDTLLADYVLNPTRRDFSLGNLREVYAAAGNAAALPVLRAAQAAAIRKNDLSMVFYEIEMPLCRVLFQMEQEGFAIDTVLLDDLSRDYAARIEAVRREIYTLAGTEEFNIASTKQLGQILFEKLGLPVVKKTKTGYSTNAEVLERLSGMHPIVDKIGEFRLLTKLKSTYLDALHTLADPVTHKVHTTFSQTATATGRISSLEPNLQNIPVRSEFTSHIRRLFVPSREGGCIVSADYSQIELRVLAHISGDAHMCDAFQKEEDIHARTASEIFGVPLAEVTPEMRSSAKAVNFGIVYGISDFGLARNLGIPRFRAEAYIERYLEEFTGVRRYMKEIVEQARREGCVRTLYGRIRYIPEIAASNFNQRSAAERIALNTPIQGTAADIIKIAMIHAAAELEAEGLCSRLISQVHDELIVDTAPGEEQAVRAILKRTMESVIALEVPLKVNVACGKNWAEAK